MEVDHLIIRSVTDAKDSRRNSANSTIYQREEFYKRYYQVCITMDRVLKNSYYVPVINPEPFELRRTEYDLSNNWCSRSKQERSIKSKPVKDSKLLLAQSSGCRKSKSTNRSPRQVRRNERERGRKARLNAAFKVLRNVIPFYSEGLSKEKLTQVQVLRLAAKYIMTLSDILGSESSESEDEYYGQIHTYQNNYEMMQYFQQQ